MTKTVIIVAGGSGKRMKSDIPKQFLLLGNKPVLMHTIECFSKYDKDIEIVLVLPHSQIEYWSMLCNMYKFNDDYQIAIGGKTRYDSVKKGLLRRRNNSSNLIAIHDGVRPLVAAQTITRCFETAAKKGNAIPVVEMHESIRKIENDVSIAVNRSEYRIVQTPQVFDADQLLTAYEQTYNENFTDDASVVETNGVQIHLVEGNQENIKITNRRDLIVAQMLLQSKERRNLGN